ncbi:hypothetical protein BH23ACT3_BH23ACT3_19630 [soil metagenome]
MNVIPLVDEGLGNSAYVVDLGDSGALVVDPERDPRPYLGELDRRGLTARFVMETHLHADFVSGAASSSVPARSCWPRPAATSPTRTGRCVTVTSSSLAG